MRKRKTFEMAAGKYYFNIKAGYNSDITISRKTRKEAEAVFLNYEKQRKDCEWLGQWDGKKFIHTKISEAA